MNINQNKKGLNVTKLSIMVNTNKSIRDGANAAEGIKYIESVFENQLAGSNESTEFVVGSRDFIKEVNFTLGGGEIGKLQHRLHIHFTIEIYHSVATYSVKKFRDRLKLWLKENVEGGENWNVYVRLTPEYQTNYNSKEKRWEKNDEIQRNYEDDEEYNRLRDDRPLLELGEAMENLEIGPVRIYGNTRRELRVLDEKNIIDKGKRSYNL